MQVPRRMEGRALVFTFLFVPSYHCPVTGWARAGLLMRLSGSAGSYWLCSTKREGWRTGDLKETFLNDGWISHISLPRHCIAGQDKMTWHTVAMNFGRYLAILVSYFILSILSGNQVIFYNIISYFFSKVILCQWEHFFKLEIGFETKH